MNLGFYYHIPIAVTKEGKMSTQGFLGVFLDAIAKEVEQLVLIGHSYQGEDNYVLRSGNIRLVDLGKKTPAWHRHFCHPIILRGLTEVLNGLDALIIRSPTPLAPFIGKYIPKTCLLRYYVVGSYEAGAEEMETRSFRDLMIKEYLKRNHELFLKELNGKDIFVNSPQLQDSLKYHCRTIENIPSSTLTEDDLFYREDTCLGDTINILFTGRIDVQKGLLELVEAFAKLHCEHPTTRLHFVGWEDNPEKPVEKALIKRAEGLEVREQIVFHGRKQLGEELWQMYRMADIYCIPSYHEGFPRTIWEAMANGLPVVATPVGAIPYYLSHQENAYFITTKSVESLVQGLRTLIENPELRKRMIANAAALVKDNTLKNRAKQLISYVEKSLSNTRNE